MPREKRPTPEDMLRAEQEIGKNIPDEMVGLDDGDVRPEAETPAGAGTTEAVEETDADEADSRH